MKALSEPRFTHANRAGLILLLTEKLAVEKVERLKLETEDEALMLFPLNTQL
jgi:hypothetical protein